MISTNDVRPGYALETSDGLCQVIETQHVKPGKGKAFVRMKLRNLKSGAVVDKTFRAGENVKRATIDRRDMTLLYKDEIGFNFMDGETFEQLSISEALMADAAPYVKDGSTIQVAFHNGQPIGVDLPLTVELEVSYAEPGVKGDRVSGATKPVTLETGLVVQSPLFIDVGNVLKVDTRSGDYITRVS